MASNLSSIGFHFADEDEFDTIMTELAGAATESVSCEAGDYVIWRAPTGAELWFHLPVFGNEDVAADLAGLTPFFAGDSDIPLKLTERINRRGDNDFEGAFTAWVAPDEATGEGSYPLVFDAVDFSAHYTRALPTRCRAKITGFAREVKAYDDETAFAEAQDEGGTDGVPLAPKAFIPVGLFASTMSDPQKAKGKPPAPSAAALLTGRVLKHLELTNGKHGQPYHWLVVESHDATFDVVADPEIVHGKLAVGATVAVSCMLFGRLLD